jgi:hypothetical protein
MDASATIRHISQALARHTSDWASDDTALLVLRVPPLNQAATRRP